MYGAKYFYRDLDTMNLDELIPGLTEEEASSPYAKYFNMGCAAPEQAVLDGSVIPAEDAIAPEALADWVRAGGVRNSENGYCITKEGYGYATSTLFIPTVPDDVVKCYESWDPQGDIAYKTWYPGAHIRHLMDGAIEDMGSGVLKCNFLSPVMGDELGFDPAELDPNLEMFMLGRGRFKKLYDGDDVPFSYMMICKYVTRVDGGIKFRTIFWNGCDCEDGVFVSKLEPGNEPSLEQMRGVMLHSGYENANSYALMYAWYEDHKND